LPVVFPAHPRTLKTLAQIGAVAPHLLVVEAQPYLEFNFLVANAKAVITDSGGVTEETTVLGIPCVTLRDTTERPETVTIGTNELIGTDPARLKPALDRLFEGRWKQGAIPELWDGRTGPRIVTVLERLLAANARA
jgi:UDP-N-acetylglucosamine 2-epimerase (non-hydrolysing)